MNDKRFGVIILSIMLIIPPLFMVASIPEARAWGTATHNFIDSEAIKGITNETWAAVFDYYSPEIISGGAVPDQWEDWDNHLYYPDTGEHNAPWAAAYWFDLARANFTIGNWEDGFFAAGVMSHYASDPCIPVHTDVYWDGHTGYEHDINDNLDSLTLTPPSETLIDNVTELVIDSATYSHQYYNTVYDAYPTNTTTAIATNATIKALTEDCLSMAINVTTSLFYTLIQGITPPDIASTLTHVAVIDTAHNNDYADGSLTEVENTLNRKGYEVRWQTTAFTAGDLTDVDLLISTCGLDAYTTAELQAIADWAATGDKAIIVTGRGDYSTYADDAVPNQILEAIGSNIRINDDNVYMEGTYKDWYIDLYSILPPADTLNLTFSVDSLRFFSPSSLYFLDEGPVQPIVFADPSAYQTDQESPAPVRVYDDTIDGENGDQIPLSAVEEIGSLRVIVLGTTTFSNFDYSHDLDNIQFFKNILDWAKGSRSEHTVPDVDEIGPWIRNVTWTPETVVAGSTIDITVQVSDVSDVASVKLTIGETEYNMEKVSGDIYKVTISGLTEAVSFTITATDGEGNIAIRGQFTISSGGTTTSGEPGTAPASLMINPLVIGSIAGALFIVIAVIILKRR